jgi:hypothetical protein
MKLCELPVELLLEVVQYLELDDVIHLRETCRTLKSVADDSERLYSVLSSPEVSKWVQLGFGCEERITRLNWYNYKPARRYIGSMSDIYDHKNNGLTFWLRRIGQLDIPAPNAYASIPPERAKESIIELLDFFENEIWPIELFLIIRGPFSIDTPEFSAVVKRVNNCKMNLSAALLRADFQVNRPLKVYFSHKFVHIYIFVFKSRISPMDCVEFDHRCRMDNFSVAAAAINNNDFQWDFGLFSEWCQKARPSTLGVFHLNFSIDSASMLNGWELPYTHTLCEGDCTIESSSSYHNRVPCHITELSIDNPSFLRHFELPNLRRILVTNGSYSSQQKICSTLELRHHLSHLESLKLTLWNQKAHDIFQTHEFKQCAIRYLSFHFTEFDLEHMKPITQLQYLETLSVHFNTEPADSSTGQLLDQFISTLAINCSHLKAINISGPFIGSALGRIFSLPDIQSLREEITKSQLI